MTSPLPPVEIEAFAPPPVSPEQGVLLAFLDLVEPPPPPADRPLSTLAALRERYRDDFLGFCSLLEIVSSVPGQGLIPFTPNEVQLLFCEGRTGRDVILKARQLGFTTIELARDVWFFLTRQSAVVKVVCQSISDHAALNTNAKRISVMFAALAKRGLKISFAVEATGHWRLPDADGAATLDVVEAGASAAAAEKKGRTDSVGRLHVTEVAFFEYAAKTLNALMASVAAPETGSEVVFESTANGMGSDEALGDDASGGPYFYSLCQQAQKGTSGYTQLFFPWWARSDRRLPLAPGETILPETERERQCAAAGVTPEQLKWYRRELASPGIGGSQDKMDQEFASDARTCFLVSGRMFFDKARIELLLAAAKAFKPLNTVKIQRPGAVGTLTIFHTPEAGRSYIVVSDASEGTGGDRGTAHVLERGTGRHMATLAGQFKPPELARECERLGYAYATVDGIPALVVVERNNHGHAVLQELEREDPPAMPGNRKRRYPKIFKDHDDKPGWLTHEVSRAPALAALEQVIREGKWSSVCVETLGEMRTFVINKKGKAEAAGGAKDDLVITAAIAWDVLGRLEAHGKPPRGVGMGWGGG